jgi:hypothetical protein
MKFSASRALANTVSKDDMSQLKFGALLLLYIAGSLTGPASSFDGGRQGWIECLWLAQDGLRCKVHRGKSLTLIKKTFSRLQRNTLDEKFFFSDEELRKNSQSVLKGMTPKLDRIFLDLYEFT